MYSCHLFLISSASVKCLAFCVPYCAHLCFKSSLGISSISHSIVFFYLFVCIVHLRRLSYVGLKWSEVKVTQSCPTLCDPMSTVCGILQARILEWVAVPFSRGFFRPRDRTQVSCIVGGFFTSWDTREALCGSSQLLISIHSIDWMPAVCAKNCLGIQMVQKTTVSTIETICT